MITPIESTAMMSTPNITTNGMTKRHHVEIGTRPIINAPVTTAKVGVNRLSKPEAD